MQIAIMNLKTFWGLCRTQGRAVTAALPSKAGTPKPFEPLTRQESIAILEDTIQWLMDEARATFLMPPGPSKERRRAELWARHKSISRDSRRLTSDQEG